VPVFVVQTADPHQIIELLNGVAAAHSLVTKNPPPQALVVNLGPSALSLELRAWTDRTEDWMQIHSELEGHHQVCFGKGEYLHSMNRDEIGGADKVAPSEPVCVPKEPDVQQLNQDKPR
jgi:hypothetical protein